jgi:hypothetical protein
MIRNTPNSAPAGETPSQKANRLIGEAVATLYLAFRAEGDEPAEARAEALNTALLDLMCLAADRGLRLDFAEGAAGPGLDVEFVTHEEYAQRPEPTWLAFARRVLAADMTEDDVLREVSAFRERMGANDGNLFERKEEDR